MAKHFQQKLTYWSPRRPKVAWIALCIAIFTSFAPFLVGIYASLSTESGHLTDLLRLQLWESFKFTSSQAALSTAIVVLLSPVLGMSLIYIPQTYQRYCSILRTLVFCLPSVVVASGILICWGKEGIGSQILAYIGISDSPHKLLYSNYAVVIANVSMNLPFASLLIFRGIKSIDINKVLSVRLLGLNYRQIIGALIIPAIRPRLLYFAGLNFLVSMSSFGALNIFSGTNSVSTLEMNIYQSLYLNSDWLAASVFAISHTVCAGVFSLIFLSPQYFDKGSRIINDASNNLDNSQLRSLFPKSTFFSLGSIFVSILFDALIAAPIFAVQLSALVDINRIINQDSELPLLIIKALSQSLAYALPAAALSTVLAWCLARAHAQYSQMRMPVKSTMILLGVFSLNLIPSMASSFGFLALRTWFPNFEWMFWSIVLLHAVLVLPYLTMMALQIYTGDMKDFFLFSHALGISTATSIKYVEWPQMRNIIFIMFVFAMAISINETAIVSMLGPPESPTLTTIMIRLMGHYRFADSAIVSSILITCTAIPLIAHFLIRNPNHGGR
jgi:ABC-type Fe3+ transport system permease subunit